MEKRAITAADLAKAERFGEFCPVFKIDATTIIKTGDCVRLAEAKTMEFVREHTTIPVPEVYNIYKDQETGHVRIVMEFIEGNRLEDMWDKFDVSQKKIGPSLGASMGQHARTNFSLTNWGGYGPYDNESEFNKGIVTALKRSQQGPWVDVVCEMITSLKNHKTVLTHGDFAPRNILVRGTKVVAVLDWELSGYYPEYWEYVKALWRPPWETGWIKAKAVDQVLKMYLTELGVVWHTRDIIW
ncbi:hypothetical protein IFR05_013243 [Cadophora sp. M221]|nr:hypothetical protein IFR05_013243 [Cadophora sp. M221]